MTEKIHLLIADDHAVLRDSLMALMETKPDIQVVGQAANGAEAIEKTKSLSPDVVLLDLVMPHMDGLKAITEIHKFSPSTRILVLTSFSEDDKVFTAIREGALGYLLKDATAEELLGAIRAVYRGESSLAPVIARKVLQEFSQPKPAADTEDALTERELDVLKCLAQGHSNQQIASQLSLSERTVHSHVSSILHKLHVRNRTQAALYAKQKKLD
jgi:two-component system, NarL family, response regulator LiaR